MSRRNKNDLSGTHTIGDAAVLDDEQAEPALTTVEVETALAEPAPAEPTPVADEPSAAEPTASADDDEAEEEEEAEEGEGDDEEENESENEPATPAEPLPTDAPLPPPALLLVRNAGRRDAGMLAARISDLLGVTVDVIDPTTHAWTGVRAEPSARALKHIGTAASTSAKTPKPAHVESPITTELRALLMRGAATVAELKEVPLRHGVKNAYGTTHWARSLPPGYVLDFDEKMQPKYRVYSAKRVPEAAAAE